MLELDAMSRSGVAAINHLHPPCRFCGAPEASHPTRGAISSMFDLSKSSIIDFSAVRWNRSDQQKPQESGIYLTRNDKDQAWFKYYESNFEQWTMSWSEFQANMPRQQATVADAELASQVAAWAHVKNL
jgi:hypothetical protein